MPVDAPILTVATISVRSLLVAVPVDCVEREGSQSYCLCFVSLTELIGS